MGGGGATATGAAAQRAAQRESMLNVTAAAAAAVPVSTTLVAGVAATDAKVLSDPCEATAWARSAGPYISKFFGTAQLSSFEAFSEITRMVFRQIERSKL